jgi:hypothetical protein
MMRRRRGGLRGMGGDFYPSDQQLGVPGSGTDYDIAGSENTVINSYGGFSVPTSSGGSGSGGDYCIDLSSGNSVCFSLWTVALVGIGSVLLLGMLSGKGRRR